MLLIKRVGNKINFIDDTDVFVGFDYTASCCEDFGYWFSYNTKTDYSLENENEFDFDGYRFDREWVREKEHNENNFVFFKLIKPKSKNIYLGLYNYHNGYYGHGFSFTCGNNTIYTGTL